MDCVMFATPVNFHQMAGGGFPDASHSRTTFSSSITSTLLILLPMVGPRSSSDHMMLEADGSIML